MLINFKGHEYKWKLGGHRRSWREERSNDRNILYINEIFFIKRKEVSLTHLSLAFKYHKDFRGVFGNMKGK